MVDVVYLEEIENSNNSKLRVPKNQVISVDASDSVAKEVESDVFDMVQKSYAAIGGHARIKNPGDIGGQYPKWDLVDVDDDPEPDVVQLGSVSAATGGIKGGGLATDGTPAAKAKSMNMLKTFFSTPGNWGELSGAVANIIVKKLGFKPIADENRVRELLKGKEIEWLGTENPEGNNLGVDGWYSRNIGGTDHVKLIIGNV